MSNCLAHNNVTSTTYEVINIGDNVGNVGVFAGENISDDTITFEFKSLTAGNNISLATNSDTITISSDIIESSNNSIVYNYGQVTSINLEPSYNSPVTVISNVGDMDQDSGSVVQTGLTTIDYYPSPRNKKAAFFTFTTTSTSATNNSIVKMYPNIFYANDQSRDYMLAAGADGLLYQISPVVAAENRMLNYDGTLVGLTNLSSIAFDIADNLLFYTQTTSPNAIRVYDFATQTDNPLLAANLVSAWTAGAIIADLCFCECTGTLYAKGDTTGSRILGITIKPYDHVSPLRFDIVAAHFQPFTLTGGVTFSVTITDNYDMYFAVRPSVGNSQL